jgi:hypothetical protein
VSPKIVKKNNFRTHFLPTIKHTYNLTQKIPMHTSCEHTPLPTALKFLQLPIFFLTFRVRFIESLHTLWSE